MASRKSEFGHVYSLIVNAEEQAELEALDPAEHWETDPDTVSVLERLERSQIIPPSRLGLRVVRGLYQRTGNSGCVFAVSPFIVARAMDWRHQHRVLIGSIMTGRVVKRRSQDAALLRFVFDQPRTEEQIWRHCSQHGVADRAELQKAVEQLKEHGVLVICELAKYQEGAGILGANLAVSGADGLSTVAS